MITPDEKNINIIAHILEYCNQIDECLSRFGNNREAFLSDVIFRNAVSMAEFQIGELSGHLSDDFKEKTKNEIPWKEIRGMRNIFAHNYLEMDVDRIWDVATEDISILKDFCKSQLNEFLKIKGQNIDEGSLKFIKETLKIKEWTTEAQEKNAERMAGLDEQNKNKSER